MSTIPNFTTIPPEVRLMIYKCVLSSSMRKANSFFQKPAYDLVFRGTSPFTRSFYEHDSDYSSEEEPSENETDEQIECRTKKQKSRWALLHVCKLVRQEVLAQIVHRFRDFTVADMRAWAACVGETRVAAMRRWTLEAVIDCHDSYDADPGEADFFESESEGDGEESSADEDEDEDEDSPRFHNLFHIVGLEIDLNRLGPDHIGKPYEESDSYEEPVHRLTADHGYFAGCFGCCLDSSTNEAHSSVEHRLLQGRRQPTVISGELLCSMLDGLSQGAGNNSKRRRLDWRMFENRLTMGRFRC
ncbi:hypothetical protein PG999_007350 [Apiospora kogelbergensis]|uniref:F-box domain-containing protein n=1 Tax=Apiospora kogelbergensis TaxID=1337665 RepID=A0AAW0QY58_9PEZI